MSIREPASHGWCKCLRGIWCGKHSLVVCVLVWGGKLCDENQRIATQWRREKSITLIKCPCIFKKWDYPNSPPLVQIEGGGLHKEKCTIVWVNALQTRIWNIPCLCLFCVLSSTQVAAVLTCTSGNSRVCLGALYVVMSYMVMPVYTQMVSQDDKGAAVFPSPGDTVAMVMSW